MTSPFKSFFLAAVPFLLGNCLFAQSGGDAGIGTIGNFDAPHHDSASIYRHELDLSFNYGTSDGGIRYYQPQLNYRSFNRKGSFFELSIPVNSAAQAGTSVTGVGDVLATYNSSLRISTSHLKYSLGLRVSVANADKSDGITSASYPMYLQPNLGTTDILLAASYDFCKFLSLGAGIQLPVIQYNKNIDAQYVSGVYSEDLENFRRQPDAMLKLTGHFGTGKFRVNAGVIAIFHLSDDYYTASNTADKYDLVNSNGTNLNAQVTFNYRITNRFQVGLLYAKSMLSTDINADGLARNMIISPKLTYAF